MCGVVGMKDSPIIITYYFLFVNKRRKIAGSRVVAPRKWHFFYYNIYFIICQVYMAGERDESNIFLMKRMTMTVL